MKRKKNCVCVCVYMCVCMYIQIFVLYINTNIYTNIVYINNQKATKAGDMVNDGDTVEVRGNTLKYVSRGGLKLEKAMTHFGATLEGKVCMDVGAATGGFTDRAGEFLLKVEFPEELLVKLPKDKQEAAIGVLSHDPRPSYQRKPERIYGLTFAGYDIRFQVNEDVLTVVEVNPV